jgi:Domain of unknown function (DUF6430)
MASATMRDLRTRRFLTRLVKESLVAFGFFAALAGVVAALFPDALDDRGAVWVVVIAALSIGFGLWRSWPRPIERSYTKPNTAIRLVRGDLFEEPGHVVVGACDTFDTQVPNVISPRSVQGQALQRLYGGDLSRLDGDLDAALKDETPIATVQKEGKTDRYRLGTVAALPQGPRMILFLAYTEMNDRNEARGTSDGIWRSMLSLWEAVSHHCNGEAVAIPVLGGGQARISQILPAQDSIRFIAFSFMLASRREKVCDELRIVVRPGDYEKLNRLELQAFLDSLEMS